MADLSKVYDALRNADAAGDTAGAQKLAAYISSQSANDGRPAMETRDPNEVDPISGQTRGQMEAQLAKYNSERGPLSDAANFARTHISNDLHNVATAGHAIGMGGIKGVTGLADLASAPLIGAANAGIAGYDHYRSPSLSETITGKQSHQLPYFPLTKAADLTDQTYLANAGNTPQTAFGKILSAGAGAASGALTTAGLGGLMGGTSASPLVSKIGQFLSANPKLQAVGAATGGASGEATKQHGGSPTAQLAASLIGSTMTNGIPMLLKGGVRPTPEANALMNEGNDLTGGQMRPGGIYDNLEAASQHVPILGPLTKSVRSDARNGAFNNLIANKTAAPGAQVTPSSDVQQTLSDAYDSFKPAYQQVEGFPLRVKQGQPVIMNEGADQPIADAMKQAINAKNVMASKSTRAMVQGVIDDQLSKPIKTSGDLLDVRSSIRDYIRKVGYNAPDAPERQQLLQNAEDVVTKALDSQLPKNLMDKVKDIDLQYAKHKIVEQAVASAKDQPVSVNNLSNAIATAEKSRNGVGSYARGGGLLREDAKNMASVFNESVKPTGAALPSAGASAVLAPLIGALTLSKGGRNLAAGRTAWQQALQQNNVPLSSTSAALAQILGAQ